MKYSPFIESSLIMWNEILLETLTFDFVYWLLQKANNSFKEIPE